MDSKIYYAVAALRNILGDDASPQTRGRFQRAIAVLTEPEERPRPRLAQAPALPRGAWRHPVSGRIMLRPWITSW